MSNFYTEPFVSAGEMEFPSQPYITAQPQNHTATGIEDYVLTVIAAGAVSYQWEVFNGIGWATVPGATSDTLSITIDPSMNGWRYRVLVTGVDGSTVISKAAQIAVKGVHEYTLEGAIVTFIGPARIKSLEIDVNPVQVGSGDPSPTNVRPISGWDEVNVVRTGKNLANFVDGYGINNNGNPNAQAGRIATLEPIYIKEGQSYKFVALGASNPKGLYAVWNGNTLVRRIANVYSGETIDTSGGTHFYMCAYTDITVESAQAMVILSTETDLTYEPYNGTTYPITLPSTCYGGNIKDGVLTVTHGIVTFDGTEDWLTSSGATNGTYFYLTTAVPFVGWGGGGWDDAICNRFKKATIQGAFTTEANNTFWWNTARTGYRVVYGLPHEGTSLSEFKAYLQANPLVMCGKLATPVEITLSDYPTITLLSGINNMWADSGDISVTIIR